jgi:hypothetical protein
MLIACHERSFPSPRGAGLSACHDGFRAGVRAGTAAICGLGYQSQPNGIIFAVQAHTLKLALISYTNEHCRACRQSGDWRSQDAVQKQK